MKIKLLVEVAREKIEDIIKAKKNLGDKEVLILSKEIHERLGWGKDIQ